MLTTVWRLDHKTYSSERCEGSNKGQDAINMWFWQVKGLLEWKEHKDFKTSVGDNNNTVT